LAGLIYLFLDEVNFILDIVMRIPIDLERGVGDEEGMLLFVFLFSLLAGLICLFLGYIHEVDYEIISYIVLLY
jgi:hypothetical protein